MAPKSYINQQLLLQQVKRWVGADVFEAILKRSAKIVIINIIGALLLFISNYMLVHIAGEKIYGEYVIINVWISFFSVICLFGMDDYFIATLQKYASASFYYNNTSAILLWSGKVLLGVFIGVAAFFLLSFNAISWPSVLQLNRSLFLLILFLLTFMLLLVYYLRGINLVEAGQWIEKTVRPALTIVCVGALFFSGVFVPLRSLLFIQVFGISVALLLLAGKTKGYFKQPRGYNSFDKTGKANLVFLCISLLNLLSTRLDILFLSKEVLSQEVGHYNIAARLADLVAFPLIAFNLVVPVFVSRTFYNAPAKTTAMLIRLSKLSAVVMGVALLLAVVFGKWILSFFGPNFVQSFAPFLLLCVAHLFAGCLAPMNAFLMVSGGQRLSLLCLAIHVVFTFVFCNLLVPNYGAVGASVAILCGSFVYLLAVFYISRGYVKRQTHLQRRQ